MNQTDAAATLKEAEEKKTAESLWLAWSNQKLRSPEEAWCEREVIKAAKRENKRKGWKYALGCQKIGSDGEAQCAKEIAKLK